eukprot:1562457-Amphidinium_carterae.1
MCRNFGFSPPPVALRNLDATCVFHAVTILPTAVFSQPLARTAVGENPASALSLADPFRSTERRNALNQTNGKPKLQFHSSC